LKGDFGFWPLYILNGLGSMVIGYLVTGYLVTGYLVTSYSLLRSADVFSPRSTVRWGCAKTKYSF